MNLALRGLSKCWRSVRWLIFACHLSRFCRVVEIWFWQDIKVDKTGCCWMRTFRFQCNFDSCSCVWVNACHAGSSLQNYFRWSHVCWFYYWFKLGRAYCVSICNATSADRGSKNTRKIKCRRQRIYSVIYIRLLCLRSDYISGTNISYSDL